MAKMKKPKQAKIPRTINQIACPLSDESSDGKNP